MHRSLVIGGLAPLVVAALAGAQDLVVETTSEAELIPGQLVVKTVRSSGPAQEAAGEAPAQMPGFPVTMPTHPNFKPWRGVVLVDLVGDADLEIIASSTDSRIYAWDASGSLLPGFPKSTLGWCQAIPSVGDLDGDGDLEIVQFTRGITSGGRLYAIDHLGQNLPGFPLNVNNNNFGGAPTLVDLDEDGQLEIVAAERAGSLGVLRVFENDGTEWTSGAWPVALDHVPTGTPAVADIDGDGNPEIFTYSYLSMYLLEADGTPLPGWPKSLDDARFSYQSAGLADLDDDGDLEIVTAAHWTNAGCYVFNHDGTEFPGWPRLTGTWTYCPPTIADMEGDGELDIIVGRAGTVAGPSNAFWVWNSNGFTRPGFPFVSAGGGGSEGPLTVVDIDGDGKKEIFADHNKLSNGQGWLFGLDADGNPLPGFPLRPEGFTYLNGATVGDIDRDGDYELVVVSEIDDLARINVYDLVQKYGTPCGDGWPQYHRHAERGGLYDPGCLEGTCVGDTDGDDDVDFDDLLIVLDGWGDAGGPGDVNEDGIVDFDDLVELLAFWGPCP